MLFVSLSALFHSCKKPGLPTNPTKVVTLTLKNFIGDCKVGSSTTNDVKYKFSIDIRTRDGNGNLGSRWNSGIINSPTTASKDPVTTFIEVPTDASFYLDLIIDGIDCSLCRKGGCNPYNTTIGGAAYQVNNAPPYWGGSYIISQAQVSTNTLEIIPQVDLRGGVGTIPTCPCQIKL